MSGSAIDLSVLDRDVRRAAARVEQLRSLLALGTADARERARSFDPWEGARHTAAMTTYRAVTELEPSALDVPLRDGLLRWIHELLQARIGQELALADAEALHALDARLPAGRIAALKKAELEGAASAPTTGATTGAALEAPRESPHGPDPEAVTYAEAFAAIIAAPNEARAASALERAGELAARVAGVRKERRERCFEASRRLGLAHPFALATKGDVGALARALLDATEPLALDFLEAARKKADARWRASSAIQLGLAREARDGWPSRLTRRWLDAAFKALAPRGVDPGPLPEPLGGASFLRAASSWGFAWRTAGTPRSMPFGVARDPYPIPAFRFGFALGSVIAEPCFQKRALDLPSRLADAQSRVLRGAMFLHARTVAARALLASQEQVSPSLFEEVSLRLFGAPLPASLRDAWPEPDPAEPARLVALLGTHAFVRDLVNRFDDDWFRNPKAGRHLTSLACGPAFDPDPVPPDSPATLARAFENALG
jgi:hypothetical protein